MENPTTATLAAATMYELRINSHPVYKCFRLNPTQDQEAELISEILRRYQKSIKAASRFAIYKTTKEKII